MFDEYVESASVHFKAFVVAFTLMILYWSKEIMEMLLRIVFGVDRRYGNIYSIIYLLNLFQLKCNFQTIV